MRGHIEAAVGSVLIAPGFWGVIVLILMVIFVPSQPPTPAPSTELLESRLSFAEYERDNAYMWIGRIMGEEPAARYEFEAWGAVATGYTARAAECDSSPERTGDNQPSRIGVIEVSRDQIADGSLAPHDKVILFDERGHSLGLFHVSGTMGPNIYNSIDVLHGSVEAARAFGRRAFTILRVIGGER